MLGLARPLLSLAGLLVALSLSVDARAGTPLCPAGQFSATGFQPCEPCPAGRYADFVGAIECTACAPGTFANSTGSTSCQQCAPGSAAGAEAGFCLACAPGQFAPLAGSASCQLCPPGTAQPLPGETSCIDCAAGTHQPESGAASCLACPRNTYASQSRAVTCSNCGCDDEVACTRDGCDAVTAQCSAEPVAGCSVQTISFAGTLTRVDDALAACFELGSPVSGSWQVDPEAPDADAADPTFGSFYGALSGFEMRIGIGGAEIVTSAERATAFTRDALGQDVLEIDAEHPLTGTPVACGTRSDAILQLLDATDATRATDALPVGAEELNAFPNAEALLAFEGNGLVSSADIVFTPEPEGGSALALALLGIIQASSRARRRRA